MLTVTSETVAVRAFAQVARMRPADRLVLLRHLGVNVALASDREHLDISGRAIVIQAVAPAISKHREELLRHLRANLTHPEKASL